MADTSSQSSLDDWDVEAFQKTGHRMVMVLHEGQENKTFAHIVVVFINVPVDAAVCTFVYINSVTIYTEWCRGWVIVKYEKDLKLLVKWAYFYSV